MAATLRFWLKWDFASGHGFVRFVLMLALATGVFAVALAVARLAGPYADRARWIVAVAAVFAVVSIFAGGDTDRVLQPAGLLLVMAMAIGAAQRPQALLGLALVVLAFAVQQEPFRFVGGADEPWLEFFGLRTTALSDAVRSGLWPLLVALPALVAGVTLLLRDRSERPAPLALAGARGAPREPARPPASL